MKLQSFHDYPFTEGGVCAAQGFKANGVYCGLKHQELSSATQQAAAANEADDAAPKKNDLAMIFADKDCAAAAVYTEQGQGRSDRRDKGASAKRQSTRCHRQFCQREHLQC